MTGITFNTIHSGLFSPFEARNDSMTFRHFNASLLRCCEVSVEAL